MLTKSPLHNLAARQVTIMGLGLHGGGTAAAEYFAKQGAKVTITDLQSRETLAPSIEKLQKFNIRYVLGKHDEKDFTQADIVIKNPAVPRNSSYLAAAMEHGALIESDISVFLTTLHGLHLEQKRLKSKSECILIAVTGTKGKSSTSSAMDSILRMADGGFNSYLGGNITISPLLHLENIARKMSMEESVYITLELSSFQIGDLKLVLESRKKQGYSTQMYWPDCALLTNIFPDHLDYYSSMEAYVGDKIFLFRNMSDEGLKIIGDAGKWTKNFLACKGAQAVEKYLPQFEYLSEDAAIYGKHQQQNLGMAACILRMLGVTMEQIRVGMAQFQTPDHRLQYIGRCRDKNVKLINDSAATIPEACLRAVESFERVYLICGGSNKNIKLLTIVKAARLCRAVYLLEGNASSDLMSLLEQEDLPFKGPFDNMDEAVRAAHGDLPKDEEAVLLLSPGCASFGLFLNEFDRGRQFIAAVKELPDFER